MRFTWDGRVKRGWIDWSSFAHTQHWLKGTALLKWMLQSNYLPRIQEEIYTNNSLLEGLKYDRDS